MNESITLTLPGFDSYAEPTEEQKWLEAQQRMLAKKERALEIERRARKLRALIHDWSIGLHRYGVRHAASLDQVNEILELPSYSRRSKKGTANNINGAVPHSNNGKPGERFVSLGYIRSKKKGGHGNKILLWTMEKYETAAKADFYRENRT